MTVAKRVFGEKDAMGVQLFKTAAMQRAYLVGHLNRLRTATQKKVAEMKAIEAQIELLKAKIAAYNVVLAEQGIEIAPEDLYRPLRQSPKRGFFKHGELSSLILEALRQAQAPLSTLEIFAYAVERQGVTFQSLIDRSETRRTVKNQLRVYAHKGLVVRLNEERVQGTRVPSFWALPEFAHLPHPPLEDKASS